MVHQFMDLTVIALFILGLVLLVVGAEVLVRGASRLAAAVGISPLVVGLTVVAFGTSAPELAVSVQSALSGQGGADIALGNVVGSNIANILLILGLSAIVTPLIVAQKLVRVDVPIVIGVSVLMFLMAMDGVINRWDGLLLFGGIIGYTVFAIVQGRKENQAVQEQYTEEFGVPAKGSVGSMRNLLFILAGLVMLVVGSRWLVEGAVSFARLFDVSELIIGLTIVAIGTSLPELATSVMASIKGERDIAVGNVIGSNLFNILSVLGLAALVAPNGVSVPASALRFDMPVMIAVAVACLPIFFTGYTIARWEGLVFLGYYIAYTAYLILASAHYQAIETFSAVMLLFVVPLTVITLAISVLRQVRQRKQFT
jgi:cation:H+ antiporter